MLTDCKKKQTDEQQILSRKKSFHSLHQARETIIAAITTGSDEQQVYPIE
jgi:hypothetical protein